MQAQSTLFTRIVTLLILFFFIIFCGISYQNYISQRNQQQASLFYKLQNDFFYDNQKFPAMKRCIEEDKPVLENNGGAFDEYDLDDYLGFFELISQYIDDNVLPIDWVNSNFGYYIEKAYKSPEIKEYISHLRQHLMLQDAYSGFETMAQKFISSDSLYMKKKN
jgi:hypothetical protein